MRIFVTGATGAVGRGLVALLVSAGHSVVGMTRTPGKVETIRSLGAEAFVVNALDARAIHTAVALARPDVVVHEMTDLRAMDMRTFDRSFANTNRLRTEATDYLLTAARDAEVKLFVAQSFCGWPYARMGGPVKSETHPFDPDPPQELRHALDAIRYLEDVVTASIKPAGVILRYGALYGCDTGLFDHTMAEHIRRRHVPLIGMGMAGGHSCMSMTRRRPPLWRSNATGRGSTTSWMTIPRRFASGCRRSPICSAQSRRSTCPHGSPRSSPASIWLR